MDPIRSKPGPDIYKTGETRPAEPSAPPSQDFEVGATSAPPSQPGAAPISHPTFDRFRACIDLSVRQGHDKQQILQDLVDSELRQTFGPKSSDAMRQAVVEKFQSDPQLSGLFNQLLSAAKRGSGPE